MADTMGKLTWDEWKAIYARPGIDMKGALDAYNDYIAKYEQDKLNEMINDYNPLD